LGTGPFGFPQIGKKSMPANKRKLKCGVRYRYKKTVKGTVITSPYIYLSKTDAETAEALVIAKYQETGEMPTPTESFTVINLITERLSWLEIHRNARYSNNTRTLLKRAMVFVPEWENMPARAITTEMAEKWSEIFAADLIQRGKSRDDVNKALTALQATWNHPWGKRRGKRTLPRNPFEQIERMNIEHRAKKIPTSNEVTRILKVANLLALEKALYLKILHATAARPGEGRQLRWEDLQIDEPPYSIVLFTRKKEGGSLTPRKLEIPRQLAKELVKFKKENGKGFVFHQDGAPELHRTERWALNLQNYVCIDAKVGYFTLHSWRHYRASKWALEGIPLTTIQHRLGHENTSTTDIYLHALLAL
jgi:integrase